ncbi:MAG TPA: hydroxymethylbilane synthase [Planctomycetota bacterium]|nr:hydroxymethylbilane synthase [Planctomycetota bacterium]
MTAVRLATRISPLALWQARHVATLLRRAHPGLAVTLVPVISSGDTDRSKPLYASDSVGMFVKEVQDALVSGRADAGVHSCKDLPTTHPEGLTLAAILRRADPRDALIGGDLATLPRGALVGTSSLRRQHQLAALRPDLRFASIRGNVDTRLRKVAAGDYAATLLAMAGLTRLGLARVAGARPLDPWTQCTPAPAQGAVAVDCRTSDTRTRRLLAAIEHRQTRLAIDAERAVLAGLAGGCSLPLGCYAVRLADGRWHMRARLARGGGALSEVDATGPHAGLADRVLAGLR